MDSYKMTIAGVERDLKMFPVDETTDIAAFIMFGKRRQSFSSSAPSTTW